MKITVSKYHESGTVTLEGDTLAEDKLSDMVQAVNAAIETLKEGGTK